MNELIIIGVICAAGLVGIYASEHGRELVRDIKSIIKWNLERFK